VNERRPLIAGNWKMNHTHLEAIQVVRKLCMRLAEGRALETVDVSVHPPFVALRSVQTVLESEGSPIALGAQGCHWEDCGAYTGEVSALMLAKLNVSWVIVGHSERRQLFGETDQGVRARLEAVLRHGMAPIACVGEPLEVRESGDAIGFVTKQVEAIVKGLPAASLRRTVVAYEPIWAIGTGMNATADDAQEVCAAIREEISRHGGQEAAASVRVLYGGSVKAENAAELSAPEDVDGLLVGGASLDPDGFARLVSEVASHGR
jgi:triosephosphate isomerase